MTYLTRPQEDQGVPDILFVSSLVYLIAGRHSVYFETVHQTTADVEDIIVWLDKFSMLSFGQYQTSSSKAF